MSLRVEIIALSSPLVGDKAWTQTVCPSANPSFFTIPMERQLLLLVLGPGSLKFAPFKFAKFAEWRPHVLETEDSGGAKGKLGYTLDNYCFSSQNSISFPWGMIISPPLCDLNGNPHLCGDSNWFKDRHLTRVRPILFLFLHFYKSYIWAKLAIF